MALPITGGVTRSTVSVAISTYIKNMAIIPVAYNVPMHTVADVWRLPREGDVLRVPRGDEASEAQALDKDTIYTLENTTGKDDGSVYYDEYTIGEWGLFSNINKWAKFTTALDVAKLMGNRLINSAARTMNSLSYEAIVAANGLQWMRTDGETEGEAFFTVVAGGTLDKTTFRTDLGQADDFWNAGQVTFVSGPNAGISRHIKVVGGFLTSNGVILVDTTLDAPFNAFPNTPTAGDTGYVCCLGNAAGGPADLGTGDTHTLEQMYRQRERCLRRGAGGLGMEGPMMNVAGITKRKDGHIRQGINFMPTQTVHEIQKTLAGNAAAQDANFWQTSKGFKRAVGGVILNIGGQMVVPVNHHKMASVVDGTLTSGTMLASILLYPHAFGCTILRDKVGNRQGLDISVIRPGSQDSAVMFKSLKFRGELDLINRYFCCQLNVRFCNVERFGSGVVDR